MAARAIKAGEIDLAIAGGVEAEGLIALGHPFGMSGSRIVGSAASELSLNKKRRALVTMCIGVRQGILLAPASV